MAKGPRRRLRIALGVAALYASSVALMAAMEPWLLFPRPDLPRSELTRLAERWEATEVEVPSRDGTVLYGWRLGKGDKLALLFSGNGSTVGWQDERYRTLLDGGYSILHINYRGYPGSEGRPSEIGLLDDGLAAWAEAIKSHDPDQVVIFGKSLGGGVAMGVAEILSQLPPGQRPAALVLESTFTSAWRVGADQYPWLPVRLIMRNRFESIVRAPHVQIPTVVLHGGRDELIDPEQGAALAAAIPGAVFVPIAHHWHNDVLWNEPEALDALNAILDARR